MNQVQLVKFENKNKNVSILCNTATPLGELHDFLLEIKGHIVDRMVKAQKEEEEVAKKQKEESKKEEGKNGS